MTEQEYIEYCNAQQMYPAKQFTVVTPAIATIVTRYGVDWCTICDLAAIYCREHDVTEGDRMPASDRRGAKDKR